ncbi:MAG: hypothetical protein ABI925_03850 [Verrucomicrobiota bacterium]
MSNIPILKPDVEKALYVGAAATFVLTVAPYITACVFPSYVVGAAVAVWYAISKQNQVLTAKDGAKLGFLSTALGTAVAAVLVDMIWQFFDYQIWREQNGQFTLAIFRSFVSDLTLDAMKDKMAEDAAKGFAWYVIIIQVIAIPIISGIFGTLSGLITASVMRKKAVAPTA